MAPDSIILWSLFGDRLSNDEKSRIAARLLTIPQPEKYQAKKVKFPILTPTTKVVNLLTEISWFPFTLLGLSHSWLEISVENWKDNADYKEMEKFARSVKLTNDVAERGVKLLISDYADILTTNSDRRSYPQMRKVDLAKRFVNDFPSDSVVGDTDESVGEQGQDDNDSSQEEVSTGSTLQAQADDEDNLDVALLDDLCDTDSSDSDLD